MEPIVINSDDIKQADIAMNSIYTVLNWTVGTDMNWVIFERYMFKKEELDLTGCSLWAREVGRTIVMTQMHADYEGKQNT